MMWTWSTPSGIDIPDIVSLAYKHYAQEVDDIFEIDTLAGSRNITHAIVNQMYNPGSEFVQVARNNDTQELVAYVWVCRGQESIWSDEEMATTRMIHVDISLPVRVRLRLVQEMLLKWEQWALTYSIPIVCSVTMRRDTQGFLKLHARHGYDVRGSFAYKRLIAKESNVKT